MDKKNFHEDHRMRVRESVVENGFSHLNEHQLLELLLFYAIPRKDTNELAHSLINEFDTLDGVFKASLDKLQKVTGVGERTAILIKTVGEIYYKISKEAPPRKQVFKNIQDLKMLCLTTLSGETVEKVVLFCFDASWRLKKTVVLDEGNENTSTIDICKIVQTVLDTSAPVSVITHNHPEGKAEPSAADIDATRTVAVMLRKLGFSLADHIIVGETGEAYSMYSDPAYRGLFY